MGTIDLIDLRGTSPVPIALPIPSLSRAVAEHRTTLTHLIVEGAVTLFGSEIRYSGRPVRTSPLQRATVVELALGEAHLTVALDTDLCELLATIPGGTPLRRQLPRETLALAIEHVLTSDLELFEEAHNCEVQIVSVSHGVVFDTAKAVLGLSLTGEHVSTLIGDTDEEAGLHAYVFAEDNDALVAGLQEKCDRKPARGLEQFKVDLAYIGPLACMPKSMLDQLEEGDVLDICPEWYRLSDHINLLIKNEYILPLRAAESGFVADGPEQSLTRLRQQFEDGADPLPIDNERPDSVTDPKAVVTVELQRSEVQMSLLSDIQDGDVLDFDISSVDQVRICADGTPIAAGRLVQLEESYGVQVTKLL